MTARRRTGKWWSATDPLPLWEVGVLLLTAPLWLALGLVLATLNYAGGYGFTVWAETDDLS